MGFSGGFDEVKGFQMVQDQGYNGWKNYETWLTSLWLDNDEGSYLAVRDVAREWRAGEESIYVLADALKAFVEDLDEVQQTTGFIADLVGSALSEVEWREIAEGLESELRDEVDA